MDIKIERKAQKKNSILPPEYLVTFPDESTQIFWLIRSNLTKEQEDAEALKYAENLWLNKN